MELIFDFDQRQGCANIRFEGLDGTEDVASMKQALSLLKIRNPVIPFADAVKSGAYDHVPDAEYKRMLDTMTFISELWRYPDEPGEAPQKSEMNALALLVNTIEALSQLNAQYQMENLEES